MGVHLRSNVKNNNTIAVTINWFAFESNRQLYYCQLIFYITVILYREKLSMIAGTIFK